MTGLCKCIFCSIHPERIVVENELSLAVRDNFPVTELHSLVIPKRHVSDYFEMSTEELIACNQLLHILRREILLRDPLVEGFNIGHNNGVVAGQTIMHAHIHLIPRRVGDVPNPRGGIRSVIPGKGSY